MKSFVTSLAVLCAVCSVCEARPPAAMTDSQMAQLPVTSSSSIPSRSVSLSPAQLADAMYDYDLYVADPDSATGWFIVWSYEDGETVTSGPYYSQKSAQDWLIYCLLHGVDPRNALYNPELAYPTAMVIELPKEPDWVLYDRYDTRAAAALSAAWFEDFGLLTRITSRSVLQSQLILP